MGAYNTNQKNLHDASPSRNSIRRTDREEQLSFNSNAEARATERPKRSGKKSSGAEKEQQIDPAVPSHKVLCIFSTWRR